MHEHADRPTGPKPEDICRAAECHAAGIRKQLKAGQPYPGAGRGLSLDDALRLAERIERLARLAREAGAAEAVELTGMIEVLAAQLVTDRTQPLSSNHLKCIRPDGLSTGRG